MERLPLGVTVRGGSDWAAQPDGAGRLDVSKTASAVSRENDPCKPP